MSSNDAIAAWSRDAWRAARSEGIDATVAILQDPPVEDSGMSDMLDRYLELEAAAMVDRVADATRILDALNDDAYDDETARALFELAVE